MGITVNGNQNAGVINNVDGDQIISGQQNGNLVTDVQAREAAADLLDALRRLPLAPAAAQTALGAAADVRAALQSPAPNRTTVADRLKRLVSVVVAAGSVATSGSAVIVAIRTLAGWLGRLGAPILAQLGMA